MEEMVKAGVLLAGEGLHLPSLRAQGVPPSNNSRFHIDYHGTDTLWSHPTFHTSHRVTYAGSFTAVYGWYPDHYGASDATRVGSTSFLFRGVGNLVGEFLARQLANTSEAILEHLPDLLTRRNVLVLTAATTAAGLSGCAREPHNTEVIVPERRRFQNKVIVVTGATSGIGRAAAIETVTKLFARTKLIAGATSGLPKNHSELGP
jgi:hypothetical protein